MTPIRPLTACALVGVLTLLIPAPAIGQITRLGSTFGVWSASVRGSDIAFDSKNKVYLAVSTMGVLRGRYISEDGVPLGEAFVIQSSAAGSHFPRVAFSPDAAGGAGAFLVTWHASVTSGGTHVSSRLVSYTQGLGTEATLAESDSFWEAGPAVAYATGSKEFLVAWQGYGSYLRYRRVGLNGVPLAAARTIDSAAEGERDPNVAYNSATDEFFVVYSGWDASSATVKGQRVKAGVDQPPAEARLLGRAAATYITDVSYDPISNQYLAAWYSSAGLIEGIVVAPNGDPIGSVRALSAYFKSYDALRVAFNTTSGTHFLISQGPTAEDGGVEVGGGGIPLDSGTPITAIGGNLGNFYPRVAAHSGRAEWTMSAAHEFAVTIAQRFGTGTSGSAPPPTTTCSYTLNSAGTSVGPTGGTGYFTLTASASNCSWTASSNAAWLTSSAASGTGTLTLAFTANPNTTLTSRSASIGIAGKTFTVMQKGLSAAVHDVNGDALSDIIWQHQTTGDLIVWYMQHSTVLGWNYLSIPRVADTNWKVAGSGDLNGDGYADLVWQHVDGYLAAWMLRGSQVVETVNLSVNPVSDTNWKIRAVGDLNGNGKDDIIWQNDTTGGLIVWFMNGATMTSWSYLSISSIADLNWKIAGAGDVNGDGKADLIWHNQATGGVVAWLMNGATVTGYSYLSIAAVPDLTWKVRGVGDVNGDGRADLIWQNTSSGELVVWLLNTYQVLSYSYLSIDRVPDTNWHVVGPG